MKTLPKVGEVYRLVGHDTTVTVLGYDDDGTIWYRLGNNRWPYAMRPEVWLADKGMKLVEKAREE